MVETVPVVLLKSHNLAQGLHYVDCTSLLQLFSELEHLNEVENVIVHRQVLKMILKENQGTIIAILK